MKNLLLICLLSVCFFGSLNAQGDVRFGIHLSPTFSWLTSDYRFANNNGTNTGLKLGIFGEYYFAENYAFASGIGFAFNQGGTLLQENPGIYWTRTDDLPLSIDTLPSFPGGVNFKYNIQYVEIPVGLRMRTREFGFLRFFAEPKLVFGFESKALGSLSGAGIEVEDVDISKEVNGLALSWAFGGGVEYGISTNTAVIGGLYYQRIFSDITNDKGLAIFDPDRSEDVTDVKAIGNSLVIRIGLRF